MRGQLLSDAFKRSRSATLIAYSDTAIRADNVGLKGLHQRGWFTETKKCNVRTEHKTFQATSQRLDREKHPLRNRCKLRNDCLGIGFIIQTSVQQLATVRAMVRCHQLRPEPGPEPEPPVR